MGKQVCIIYCGVCDLCMRIYLLFVSSYTNTIPPSPSTSPLPSLSLHTHTYIHTYAYPQVAALTAGGDLVDDDTMTALVEEEVKREEVVKSGFILDGYPRTLQQVRVYIHSYEQLCMHKHTYIASIHVYTNI
eukprot:GHVU01130905.1.p1 GENE.GHVU01130905.1~~GHVU01130905.1.p1  ORF type:complete len:141 (-),score=19.60 GHVU01130905.1:44-439(-)